jgi:peptidoglycan/LPS O-acetylase OafA/YrhL
MRYTLRATMIERPAQNRIPTLDGWRCVAILLVLITHFQRSFLHQYFLDVGQHGVTIFFVLSGYLITTTLLVRDTIDLPQFYIRRFFRIMPAAWTYLLVLCLIAAFTSMKTVGNSLTGCLLFFRNYIQETPANTCTEHFWSLSLEEQFYLVWPPVLALLGRKWGAAAGALGVFAIAILRLVRWNYYSQDLRFLHTEVRADALLVGCLLALLLHRESAREWFCKHAAVLFTCSALLFAVDLWYFDALIPLHESLVIAIMIGSTALNPKLLASRFLEQEHMKITGMMSYSIYLWQGLFFRPNWGIFGIVMLPASFFLSWLCVERPCIALSRKLLRWMEHEPELKQTAVMAR